MAIRSVAWLLVDLAGKKRTISQTYGGGAVGLAWSPGGDEVWVTATADRNRPIRLCRSFAGKERLVARVPADLTLQDVLPKDALCSLVIAGVEA